jgi:hypothetical protein
MEGTICLIPSNSYAACKYFASETSGMNWLERLVNKGHIYLKHLSVANQETRSFQVAGTNIHQLKLWFNCLFMNIFNEPKNSLRAQWDPVVLFLKGWEFEIVCV